MAHILCSGWLIKSPPEHKMSRSVKLLRSQWKKRFFVLSQSGRTNDAYELNYFKDKRGGKKKGSVDLVFCSQVTEAAHPELFPHLLSVKTLHKNKIRKYYLAASTQGEMKEWVHWLCLVCGLNMTPTPSEPPTLEMNPARANSTTLDPSPGATVETRSGVGPDRVSKVFSRVMDDVKTPPPIQGCVPELEEPKLDSETGRGSGDSEPFQSFINYLNESLSASGDGLQKDETSIQVLPKVPKPLPRRSISRNFESSMSTLQVIVQHPEADSSTDDDDVVSTQSYGSEAEEDTDEVIYTIPSLQPKPHRTFSDYDIPSLTSHGPHSSVASPSTAAPPLPHRQRRVVHHYVNIPVRMSPEQGTF